MQHSCHIVIPGQATSANGERTSEPGEHVEIPLSPEYLYLQVPVAVIVGAARGHFAPDLAKEMKPLRGGFVKLVRVLIAPISFLTVAVGIGKLSDSASVGRIGLRAMVSFEAHAITSLFGNAVVTVVVARWEGKLDLDRVRAVLDGQTVRDLKAFAA